LALIRRLAVGNLYPEKKEDSLIANVYNYIFKNITGSLDRHFSGRVREKRPEAPTDGDNTSVAESYKIKQPIADGQLILLNVFADRPYDVLKKIDPEVPEDKLQMCLQTLPKLQDTLIEGEINKHTLPLVQWMAHKALPPDGIMNLQLDPLLKVTLVVQAVMWHWGFYDLAALLTATPVTADDDTEFVGVDTRNRLAEQLKDQLIELYPHFYRTGGNNPEPLEKQQRKNNPAVKAIDSLVKEISHNEWIMNCHPKLIAQTSSAQGSKRLLVPVDIKNQLANLIIKLNMR
jgi:hypothetical protein